MHDSDFNTRSSEWLGDMAVWLEKNAEDNTQQMERLRRNLRLARKQELTPRQQQMLDLYFDQGMSIPAIAQKLGLHRSTVSRTLKRAKLRLFRCLRYGF